MKLDILIPTWLERSKIDAQVAAIEKTATLPHRVIASCQRVSASQNRNFCLECAAADIVIMLDDDIEGFTPGWDARLIAPLEQRQDVCMTMARLLNPNGSVQDTCARNTQLAPTWIDIPKGHDCIIPSAAIAFRDIGLRFDCGYTGSGWEDSDYCFQFAERLPGARFILTNDCKLIHRHEQKQQTGQFWQHNREHFYTKWINSRLKPPVTAPAVVVPVHPERTKIQAPAVAAKRPTRIELLAKQPIRRRLS